MRAPPRSTPTTPLPLPPPAHLAGQRAHRLGTGGVGHHRSCSSCSGRLSLLRLRHRGIEAERLAQCVGHGLGAGGPRVDARVDGSSKNVQSTVTEEPQVGTCASNSGGMVGGAVAQIPDGGRTLGPSPRQRSRRSQRGRPQGAGSSRRRTWESGLCVRCLGDPHAAAIVAEGPRKGGGARR